MAKGPLSKYWVRAVLLIEGEYSTGRKSRIFRRRVQVIWEESALEAAMCFERMIEQEYRDSDDTASVDNIQIRETSEFGIVVYETESKITEKQVQDFLLDEKSSLSTKHDKEDDDWKIEVFATEVYDWGYTPYRPKLIPRNLE